MKKKKEIYKIAREKERFVRETYTSCNQKMKTKKKKSEI